MLGFVSQPPLVLGLLCWILVSLVFLLTIWQCFCSTKPLLVRWTNMGGDFLGWEKEEKILLHGEMG
jgi:hypothetical protein